MPTTDTSTTDLSQFVAREEEHLVPSHNEERTKFSLEAPSVLWAEVLVTQSGELLNVAFDGVAPGTAPSSVVPMLDRASTAAIIRQAVRGIVLSGVPAEEGWRGAGVPRVVWEGWWLRGLLELRAQGAGGQADANEIPYAVLVEACERASSVTVTQSYAALAAQTRKGSITAATRLIALHERASEMADVRADPAAISTGRGAQSSASSGELLSVDAVERLAKVFGGLVRPSSEPAASRRTVDATVIDDTDEPPVIGIPAAPPATDGP